MHVRLAFVLALLLLAVGACSASTEISEQDVQESPEPDIDPRGPQLSSEVLFAEIEDSVVYVQAPDDLSSGSGIVIDGGWILTNAHVVGRHDEVRLGRSNGEVLGLHPVHAVDWVFDLALVGPVDTPALPPMRRGDSSEVILGSRVLLAGFPDEGATLPTPTLTEGIMSRRRSMTLGDFSFLQVDATIASGQSGGPLVNGWGELVGISGIEFGEGEFGVALASDQMWPRIDAMIEAGRPGLPSGPEVFELSDATGPLRNFGFILEVEEGGGIDVLATSQADIWIAVRTLGGITVNLGPSPDPFRTSSGGDLFVDEQVQGGENVIATVDPGLYQVVIGSFTSRLEPVEVSSNNPLREFSDLEEGQTLPVGEIVEGDFDWVRDTDQWELPLVEGQDVVITADGIADTVLAVRLDDEVIETSDDEGIGPFGAGARVEFTAEESGTYIVEIGTFDQTRWGYLIHAEVSDPATDTDG